MGTSFLNKANLTLYNLSFINLAEHVNDASRKRNKVGMLGAYGDHVCDEFLADWARTITRMGVFDVSNTTRSSRARRGKR
jgi:S-methylmethionine-dependent homocysteine/selenocysteine methylase